VATAPHRIPEFCFRCKHLIQRRFFTAARAIFNINGYRKRAAGRGSDRIQSTDWRPDMKRLTLATLIALAAAAPLSSMAAPRVDLFVGVAPPAPLVERVPPPRHGYVWAPGHWEWNGHRHVWAAGYWVAERPGYAYTAPVWVQRGGGWYMQPERWTPYGGYERRVVEAPRYEERRFYGDGYRDRERWEHERWERRHDEDRDGVPNRYDRDRDGDGVPNRYDSRPDNPYRR
jgi:hypothetical protein